jgi:hypothetical protein
MRRISEKEGKTDMDLIDRHFLEPNIGVLWPSFENIHRFFTCFILNLIS